MLGMHPQLVLTGFLLAAATAAAVVTKVQLRSETTCPDAAAAAAPTANVSIRQVIGATDARVCAVECATWPQCAVSHYQPSNATCQLANLAGWLQVWRNSTACVSHTRPPVPPAPLLQKLLALYNFRFGTDNLAADGGAAGALPEANVSSGASLVPRQGARLMGFPNSYLEVDLGTGPKLSDRLSGSPRRATFYLKVTSYSVMSMYTLHSLYNRSQITDGLTYSGKWSKDFSGNLVFEARDLSDFKFQTMTAVVPSTNGVTYTAAATFDGSAVTFYYNGAWQSSGVPTAASTYAIRGDEVLRIGYDSGVGFNGFIHCYAIAAVNLTLTELAQLDAVC